MPVNLESIQKLFSLEGKVALVTGGSRGIGFMIAKGLLEAGARVYITSRNEASCVKAATELSQFGTCHAIASDVADTNDRHQLLNALRQREGELNILINNAGTSWGGSYEDYPDEAFAKVLRLNVSALFAMTRDLTPLLHAGASHAQPSRVVNIGSIDGLHVPTVHRTGTYAYTASKAAVHHLTKHLAQQLGPKNITVNAIAPGFFPSKMTASIFEKHSDDLAANSLLGRVGMPSDIAGSVIYLCSLAGAYTHGVILPVDGGTLVNHQHVADPAVC